MILEQIFARFAEQAPVCVMMRAILTNVLSAERLDAVFEDTAQRQYTRELAFSSVVSLLADVVTRLQPSPRRAYLARREELGVSIKATYEKINHTEPATASALVARTAKDLQRIMHSLDAPLRPPLPGFRVKVLDGNHFASTDRRLGVLRNQSSCLPGQALVVLDPQLQLILGIVPCPDAHTQERALVDQVLEMVEANDLWLEDRNFCTARLVFGIVRRRAYVLVRQHAQSLSWRAVGDFGESTLTPDGAVSEQPIIVENDAGETLSLRRIRVQLAKPTRNGDKELYLLTNLPPEVLAAVIARLYRCRWQIETAFQEATVDLTCEISSLGHPQAAILVFAVAMVCFNALSTLKAALRTQSSLPSDLTAPSTEATAANDTMPNTELPTSPRLLSLEDVRATRNELGDDLSTYHLAHHIASIWDGMDLMLPDPYWTEAYGNLSHTELAAKLRNLAQKARLQDFRKRPPQKKRSATRSPPRPGGHVATNRLLNPCQHKK